MDAYAGVGCVYVCASIYRCLCVLCICVCVCVCVRRCLNCVANDPNYLNKYIHTFSVSPAAKSVSA